jgi:hypothetical protein
MASEPIKFGTAEYQPEQQGRCVSCGFLGEHAGSEWYEATPESRSKWYPLSRRRPDGGTLFVEPGCIVAAADLSAEWRGLSKASPDGTIEQLVAQVLEKDRRCPKWFPYQPGRTPQWHVERFHMLQLEETRQAHEQRLAEMEADSRRTSEHIQKDSLAIAEATKATMEGLKDVATQTDRFTTRWTKVAVALAIGVLLLGVLAYLFPELGRHVGEAIDKFFGYPLGHPAR